MPSPVSSWVLIAIDNDLEFINIYIQDIFGKFSESFGIDLTVQAWISTV